MIDDRHRQPDRRPVARIVAHLGLDRYVAGLPGKIEVAGMHVNARGLQPVVERQRLVNLAGDVQPDVPVDAAMIGIEIVGVPLKPGSGGAFHVVRPVVHLHSQHVLLRPAMHRIRNIDSVGSNSVFIQADLFPIQEDVARLPHALKFEEDFAPEITGGQLEVFAIPRDPLVRAHVAAAVRDDLPERVDVVKAVRGADGGPLRIVEGGSFGPGRVLADKPPVEIEVQPDARRGGRRVARRRSGCERGMAGSEKDRQPGCRNRGGFKKSTAGDRRCWHGCVPHYLWSATQWAQNSFTHILPNGIHLNGSGISIYIPPLPSKMPMPYVTAPSRAPTTVISNPEAHQERTVMSDLAAPTAK